MSAHPGFPTGWLAVALVSVMSSGTAFAQDAAVSGSAIVTAHYSVRTGTAEIGSDDFIAEATKNVMMTFKIRPSLKRDDDHDQERIFEAELLSATIEIAGPEYTRSAEEVEYYEKLASHLSQHKVEVSFVVDTRGRFRILGRDKADDYGRLAGSFLRECVLVSLLPPLPEEGKPFEAGVTWSVPTMDDWRCLHYEIECASVRAWTSGGTEVELLAEVIDGRHNKAWQWRLDGVPLSVRTASADDFFRQSCAEPNKERVTHTGIRVELSAGAFPVRP